MSDFGLFQVTFSLFLSFHRARTVAEHDDAQAYAALGVFAVVPIYFGSRASVRIDAATKRVLKEKHPQDAEELDEETDEIESLTSNDALMFPILGSIVLFSLYLAFKYLDKEMLNLVLKVYFAAIGVLGLARVIFVSYDI
jgi:minor histocompatibility antigen H13